MYNCGDFKVFGYEPTAYERNTQFKGQEDFRKDLRDERKGCMVELSGRACSNFSFNNSFKRLFSCLFNYRKNISFRITRLDIAIDDRNEIPYFNVETIKRKCEKREFISTCSKFKTIQSDFEDKDFARTVYIGSSESDFSIRFYEKDKEQAIKYNYDIEQMGAWNRVEMQLRNDIAHNIGEKLSTMELGEVAFSLLKEKIRFIVPSKDDINKSRWKTCDFWHRFMGAVEPLKLNSKPSNDDLSITRSWLINGGVLGAIKAFKFLEENNALGDYMPIEPVIDESEFSVQLNQKVVSHLISIKREDLIPKVNCQTKNVKGVKA